MSGLQKCGFCDLLFGLLRRVMCARARRGSGEACYRELVGHDSVRLDEPGHVAVAGSSSPTPTDIKSAHETGTFAEALKFVFDDYNITKLEAMQPIGDFYTFDRLRRNRQFAAPVREPLGMEIAYDELNQRLTELLLSKSDTWEFDTQELHRVTGGHCLPVLCMHLFNKYDLISHFKLDPENLWKLFYSIEQNYNENNQYHNSLHAADVTQAIHCFLQQPPLKCMDKMEIMVVILAAITHDIDHPGVNHSYLVATNHPLAVMYKDKALGINDRSPMLRKKKGRLLKSMKMDVFGPKSEIKPVKIIPSKNTAGGSYSTFFRKKKKEADCDSILEHHHWRMAISCVMQSGVFDHMQQRLPDIQNMLKSLILATDITRQDDYLTTFRRYLDRQKLDTTRPDHRLMVLQMALKTADISNPVRPWSISRKWSKKVCEEFYCQGDEERKRNIPISKLCDRESDTVSNIQTGFFQFVVQPLFTEWHRYLKSELSMALMTNLVHNANQWVREGQKSELTGIVTPADQVTGVSLATSTVISNSSELLVPESLGDDSASNVSVPQLALRSRRKSYSPVKCSNVKDAIRRYSAPLHFLSRNKPAVISEYTLREELTLGDSFRKPCSAPPPTTARSAPKLSSEEGKEQRDNAKCLSRLELAMAVSADRMRYEKQFDATKRQDMGLVKRQDNEQEESPEESEHLSPPHHVVPLFGHDEEDRVQFLKLHMTPTRLDDSSTSTSNRTASTAISTDRPLLTSTSSTHSSGAHPCNIEDDGDGSGATTSPPETDQWDANGSESAANYGPVWPVRKESRDVLSQLSLTQLGRRRGSAPAPLPPVPLLAAPGKLSAPACHLIAEVVPTARRGSLPVEIMAGVAAL